MKDEEILYINHEGDGKNSAEVVYIEHEDGKPKIAETIDKKPAKKETTNEITEKSEPKAQPKDSAKINAPEEKEPAPEVEEEPALEVEEEPEDTTPLDKIEQIANSTASLPLPSEETEEIDPLLPY